MFQVRIRNKANDELDASANAELSVHSSLKKKIMLILLKLVKSQDLLQIPKNFHQVENGQNPRIVPEPGPAGQ